MTDWCRNGHDRDVTGRTGRGRCAECKRIQDRKRPARPCTHEGPCERGAGKNGVVRCLSQARMNGQVGGFARSKGIPSQKRVPRVRPVIVPIDGWEDEFGPCPVKVPPWKWFDRVAVQRSLGSEPVGRDLTFSERRGVHLLGVMREGSPRWSRTDPGRS